MAGSSRIHWPAALAGYSAGSTGEQLWRDTRRDPLAALAGYSAGSTGELLWRDTRRDPLAALAGYSAGSTSCSGGILGGIHWPAALAGGDAGYWAGSTGEPAGGRIHWPAALAGYSAGSTGEQLWRDTRWDPLASCSGWRGCGILGGIHWRAGGWPDPLASRSGGILGGIHWRAALAGYSAGSTGELLWRDTGWGCGVEASQTRIPT